jgi:hypothetical protein
MIYSNIWIVGCTRVNTMRIRTDSGMRALSNVPVRLTIVAADKHFSDATSSQRL